MIKKYLHEELKKRGEKVSKAERVRSLLQKQKKLMGDKEKLTKFQEPVLFLARRDGRVEIYEKATAGKFIFSHSCGDERFLELRKEDQRSFPYAGQSVRCYMAHEDNPYANWESPMVDSESVKIGYVKTKATDLKYEERLLGAKTKNKMVWVYIILAILIGLGLLFMLTPETVMDRIFKTGQYATESSSSIGPTAGMIWLSLKRKLKGGKR